jgi:hypothetical protein
MTSDCRNSAWIGGITVRIVDRLEVVEIDEQQRNRQTARKRADASRFETLQDRATVQHARQRIELCAALRFTERPALIPKPIGHAERHENRSRDHRQWQAHVQQHRLALAEPETRCHGDGQALEQEPRDQEPACRTVSPTPGQERDDHREHRCSEEHQITDVGDDAACAQH